MSTDPTALAREVLTIDVSAIGGNIIVDGVDVLETTRAAQKLARAVLRMEALADRLDNARRRSDALSGIAPGSVASAEDIRTALNGDNA